MLGNAARSYHTHGESLLLEAILQMLASSPQAVDRTAGASADCSKDLFGFARVSGWRTFSSQWSGAMSSILIEMDSGLDPSTAMPVFASSWASSSFCSCDRPVYSLTMTPGIGSISIA